MNKGFRIAATLGLVLILMHFVGLREVQAGLVPEINITLGANADGEMPPPGSTSLQILFLTVFIALLPSILMVMTSFTRIIIVFSFVRSALGTQQMPPNQVLIGLALMLTLLIMNPVIVDIMDNALTPLSEGYIEQNEAISRAMEPLRGFMLRQVTTSNLSFFAGMAGEMLDGDDLDSIPSYILIPAFILTEITRGFIFGVIIYIPFIVIDMVVASVLMAMGMMMLPPAMISLPFKMLLFVLVDGWRLLIEVLIGTFAF